MSEPLDDQIREALAAQPPRAAIQAELNADNALSFGFLGAEPDLRAMLHKLNAEYEKWEAARQRGSSLIVPANGKLRR